MKKIYIFILLFVSSILSATEYYLEKYDVTVIDETYSSSGDDVYYFSCSDPDVSQNTASSTIYTDTYIHALELLWSRAELRNCLYEKPDCTPEPAPDGLLTILPSLSSDVCNDYVSQGTYTLTDTNTTYTDLFCYVDTCSNDLTDVALMGKISYSYPDGFPTIDDKGVPNIEEHPTSEDDCILGTVYNTSISYAVVIGWNSATNQCVYATYFCNSGLYWDKDSKSCKIPYDQLQPTEEDGISSELLEACSSGQWAKRWTYDYCGQELCYIALDVADYGLQCNNKYIEYDCTSDYRLKFFKRVSCGAITSDSYDEVNLSISGTADSLDPNNVVFDTNTTATTTDISSIINSGVSSINNNLDGLVSVAGDLNSKLDGIKSSVDSLNNAINPATDADYSALNEQVGNANNLFDSFNSSLSSLEDNLNNAKLMFESGFTYKLPTDGCVNPSFTFHGSNIELDLCGTFSTFQPIVYFISLFSFTLLAIKIFILGFTI